MPFGGAGGLGRPGGGIVTFLDALAGPSAAAFGFSPFFRFGGSPPFLVSPEGSGSVASTATAARSRGGAGSDFEITSGISGRELANSSKLAVGASCLSGSGIGSTAIELGSSISGTVIGSLQNGHATWCPIARRSIAKLSAHSGQSNLISEALIEIREMTGQDPPESILEAIYIHA